MSDDAGMHGEFGQALEPVASGSKRKRTMEWAMEVPEADVRLPVDHHDREANHDSRHQDNNDQDKHGRHTPKRSRPSPSPKQQPRSIRRKDARYGLSSLNKRHAEPIDVDVDIVDNTRPSRFQEGSMSDKPSAQPPSVFTRDHSNSGVPALANVDHLMSQYHEENSTPSVHHQLRPTVNHPLQDDPVDDPPPPPASVPTFDSIPPSTTASVKPSGGLFRFGKMFASTFNPANVWESFSRTWKESKEDLTVRNIEENRKRAQAQPEAVLDDKALYEQAYQELKKSGQFNFTVVPNKALTSPRIGGNSQFNSPTRQPLTSPRHAAAYARLRPDADFPHSRDTSLDSTGDAAAPPQLAALFKRSTDPLAEPRSPQLLSPEKPLSKRKSFFTLRGASLRAPSLSSLRRGRSHANLSETFVPTSEDKRTPSLSPEKPAFHNHLTLQSLPRSQSKRELNKTVKLNKRSFDLTHLRDSDHRRESVIVIDTPRSEIQSFLPVDYYQDPMDPAAIASSEAADQSDMENRPSLDAKLKALEASVKSRHNKQTPTKKRKSASKDDAIYKPPADEEEDELEYVKEKPKKKRKSTGKKAATAEPANEQPGSDVGHGKMIKTNTKKQDNSKQQATEEVIDHNAVGRSSLDTLDPINEEDNVLVAPRVDSTHSLVPSQHDSACFDADAESIHVRTEPLKSILVNKHETVRPSSRGSNKRPSSSQRRSSPPPSAVYTKPTLVAIEKHHVITVTPGVGSVPAMPTTTLKTTLTEEQASAGAGSKHSILAGADQVTNSVTVELQDGGVARSELIDDEALELLLLEAEELLLLDADELLEEEELLEEIETEAEASAAEDEIEDDADEEILDDDEEDALELLEEDALLDDELDDEELLDDVTTRANPLEDEDAEDDIDDETLELLDDERLELTLEELLLDIEELLLDDEEEEAEEVTRPAEALSEEETDDEELELLEELLDDDRTELLDDDPLELLEDERLELTLLLELELDEESDDDVEDAKPAELLNEDEIDDETLELLEEERLELLDEDLLELLDDDRLELVEEETEDERLELLDDDELEILDEDELRPLLMDADVLLLDDDERLELRDEEKLELLDDDTLELLDDDTLELDEDMLDDVAVTEKVM
ncbi:hypothetical protein D6D01_03643 [Aureobasidium pullulans]|uniref:Uncharacterized protein n=1 Tax=Aureobasidium pullulans TaxID=5580 RepID=A0A4S9LJA8_AURPU|nr:hypothetical protein D6D01_03643 [Aureobasidium pullulans]